jgi:uncharacterized protein (TIGR00296 family)
VLRNVGGHGLDHAYSDDEGTLLVKLARQTVDSYVLDKTKPGPPDDAPSKLWEKSGVFVTLNLLEEDHVRLRGCIGRPYPTQPLIEATIDSAVDSAVNDPRFRPVFSRLHANWNMTVLTSSSILYRSDETDS